MRREKTISSVDLIRKIGDFFISRGYEKIEPEGLVTNGSPQTFAPGIVYPMIRKVVVNNTHLGVPNRTFALHRIVRHVAWDRVGYSDFLSFFQIAAAIDIVSASQLDYRASIIQLANLLFDIIDLEKQRCIVTVFGGGKIKNLDLEPDFESLAVWKDLGLTVHVVRGEENFHFVNLDQNPAGFYCNLYFDKNGLTRIASIVLDKYKYQKKTDSLVPINYDIVWSKIYIEKCLKTIQGKDSIWKIDLLEPLIRIVHDFLSTSSPIRLIVHESYLLVDYIRTILFILYDGQLPDSTPRGRKLKEVIGRLVSTFHSLGVENTTVARELIEKAVELHQDIYPDIGRAGETLNTLIANELKCSSPTKK